MADERETRLNEGLDKWLQVTDTDKLETWDGTDKMPALKESLGINDNVAISDIVDDLNSTDVDKPLSANQGKVLQDGKEDADNTILKEGDVEDSLNSTSTTKPLSANQGKQLNDDKASLSGGADANFTAMPLVGGNPIISKGSNSNGEWVRFADGTQIIKRVYTRTSENYDTLTNTGLYRHGAGESQQVSFPVDFIDTSYKMSITSRSISLIPIGQVNSLKNVSHATPIMGTGSNSTRDTEGEIIVIGDWI